MRCVFIDTYTALLIFCKNLLKGIP